ncbi:MAG: serine/threonine protein phosphatase [Rhodospirillales bacterium]|nr:serine/threonine protein phosphatase [Rhodospirillales bacterium]MDE2200382.1 serine/threonine protein phosphatase [Rhodospirillales bacterium]MDE2576021.1 serine/threonine protein phosphatase [Rhodospirillales bacterium]
MIGAQPAAGVAAALPDGQRIYAIGDIHGCADRLAAMHRRIAADLAHRPAAHALVVHLGDYIDRGPESAAVIEMLIAPFPALPGTRAPRVINLLGNHEDMLLATLASGGQPAADSWLRNGGGDTLASWKLSWRDGPAAWARAIPPTHLGFLRGLALIVRAGGYVFVHAGLHPGRSLAAQTRDDLLWIREPFLSFAGPLPACVVHGHTPDDAPVRRANRIGIDTGAVLGGALTCAVLEGRDAAFLQT